MLEILPASWRLSHAYVMSSCKYYVKIKTDVFVQTENKERYQINEITPV